MRLLKFVGILWYSCLYSGVELVAEDWLVFHTKWFATWWTIMAVTRRLFFVEGTAAYLTDL